MFNGNGLNRPSNDNDKFQYNARLMWQPNGNQVLAQRAWVSGALYSEADFESTTVPLYALGVQLRAATTFIGHDDRRRSEVDIVGVDGVYKFKGFSATGEYFFARARTPETGGEVRLERRLHPGRHDAQPVPHLGSGRPVRPARGQRTSSTTTTSQRSAAGSTTTTAVTT